VKAMRNWAWTSVLVKVMYLSLLFLVLSVGISKITTLFLSWLNQTLTEHFGLVAITIIFMLVGITMFLLPPVPGVPVYITSGVVIVNAARADFGFWGAFFFATAVSLCLKLSAIFMQQRGFGEGMSHSVKIRYIVGVNSVTIQAIRRILEQDGFRLDKISILCGGPDWPTSVLTGILRLSPTKMLIASLPIYFLILPCVAAGAFLLRQSEGGVWLSLAPMAISLAALTQTSALILAMYYIEQVSDQHREELLEHCNDKEVAALEERDKIRQKIYREVTDWSVTPRWIKAVIFFGAVFLASSAWIIQMNGSSCFEPYEITDTIEDKLDNNPLNLVLFLGWVSMGLMTAGLVCLWIFRSWAKSRMKAGLAKEMVSDRAQ